MDKQTIPEITGISLPGSELPKMSQHNEVFKIIIGGEIGTGKSSFLHRTVRGTFNPHCRATIGVDFGLKVYKSNDSEFRYQFWDVSGQERFGNMLRVYCQNAVACIICIDITRPQTFEGAKKWIAAMKNIIDHIPIFVMFNKTDICEEYPQELADEFSTFIKQTYENDIFKTYNTAVSQEMDENGLNELLKDLGSLCEFIISNKEDETSEDSEEFNDDKPIEPQNFHSSDSLAPPKQIEEKTFITKIANGIELTHLWMCILWNFTDRIYKLYMSDKTEQEICEMVEHLTSCGVHVEREWKTLTITW